MTIVFEQEQRCRLVLQNTKKMGQPDAYQPRNGRLSLRAADFGWETRYFAEMFPFGQFCRKNDDCF
jgi:hypothetical protein